MPKNAWRERARKRIRLVVADVFALEVEFYMGCGFHYDLEKRAGYLLGTLNNFDRDFTELNQIAIQCSLTFLCRDVSLAKLDVKKRFVSGRPAQ